MNLKDRRKLKKNYKKEKGIVSKIESTHDIDIIRQRYYTKKPYRNQRTE